MILFKASGSRFVRGPKQRVTKTYKVTGSPELVSRLERFLSLIHLNGVYGHSGIFGMSFDGDGSDQLIINGVDHKANAKEVEALSGYGGTVEYVDEGGSSVISSRGESKHVYTKS